MKNLKPTALFCLLLSVLMAACGRHTPMAYVAEESMSISDELSNQNISAFAEDTLGYIWMATQRGLNRYNGHNYHQFFHNEDDSLSLPSDIINCLFVDSRGNLWVGTSAGCCIYVRDDAFHRIASSSKLNNVHQIWENREGRIFVNMVEQLCEYDPAGDSLKTVVEDFDPSHSYVNNCHVDSNGDLWSVTCYNIRCFNGRTLELKFECTTEWQPHYSQLDHEGNIWVSTGDELHIFNIRQRKTLPLPEALANRLEGQQTIFNAIYSFGRKIVISTYRNVLLYDESKHELTEQGESDFPWQLPQGEVNNMFMDSHHLLWVGMVDQGVATCDYGPQRFCSDTQLKASTAGHSITSLTVDHEGQMWLAEADNKLLTYRKAEKRLVAINLDKLKLQHRFPDNTPSYFYYDSRHRLWIINNERLIEAQVNNGRAEMLKIHTEVDKTPTTIVEDGQGNLWTCGYGNKVFCLKSGETSYKAITMPIAQLSVMMSMLMLQDGRMALGAALKNPFLYDPKTGKMEQIPIWSNNVEKNMVTCLTECNARELLIGTYGSGLFRYDLSTRKLSKVKGLPCNELCCMVKDRRNNVWISTMKGICKYKVDDDNVVAYFASDGIGGNQFNMRAACTLPNGDIAFGGTHGITIFNPEERLAEHHVRICFEDLKVNNQLVRTQLGQVGTLDLPHDATSFSVSFAPLDYKANKYHCLYQLEGYSDDWIDIGEHRDIFFSNLPAGKYKLKVRVSSDDESVAISEQQLSIILLPSMWATWWMRLIYVIIIGGALGLLLSNRLRLARERKEAERLEQEKRHEQMANRINMSFFANISHEFRTPLTMMVGPIKELGKHESLSSHEHQLLDTIEWAVNRMLRLVNQLLDFNKLENDALPLKVQNRDIIKLLKDTIEIHHIGISEKDIHLKEHGIEDHFYAPIDPDKFDKVITNLMSNALKYTPKNGEISCSFDVDQQWMIITVSDNGISIPEDKLEKIFERHYQVENHKNYGTGIGLYFARKLMELHHGSIYAENIPNGGVKFTVKFPATDVYSPAEHDVAPETDQQQAYPLTGTVKGDLQTLSVETDGEETGSNSEKKTVLIVDDEPGIVNYLRILLQDDYNILHAYDADTAFNLASEEEPDIILSDVAMPHKDGFQLCRQLKADLATSHIPVILVTAKTTTDEQIEGLNVGAEAYITKPFDPDYLKAMIRSQLANRDRLRSLLTNNTTVAKVEEQAPQQLNDQDKAFMDELYSLMESELSNDELNINTITSKLFVSRSKLYYKIKALTGEKPNEFFKKYKLNRAAELLREGKYNVSEVSDLTGFSSLTVFSRNFKAHFGMTPTDYLKQH
jgi:signal transduction histidine kinase/ligand-binding sensor domain-containing protein/DNA-binding response OmpR family regulator